MRFTIDAPQLHDAWHPPVDAGAWPGFVVALDGDVRAAADPLGSWWEWRARLGSRAPHLLTLFESTFTDRDRAILALETAWPRHGGAKEEAIRETPSE